jgi:hypothetical protein
VKLSQFKSNKNAILIALLFAQPAAGPTACAELRPAAGLTIDIPINSGGPIPQTVQPATPQPPLPTDTVHPFSEWPPKKP